MPEKKNAIARVRAIPDHSSKCSTIVENRVHDFDDKDMDKSKQGMASGRRSQRPYSDNIDNGIGALQSTPTLRVGRLVPPPSTTTTTHQRSSGHQRHLSSSSSNGWSRHMAEKLSFRWRLFGSCGVICLVISSLSILWLNNIALFIDSSPKSNSNKRSGIPDWFSDREIPKILKSYADKHKRYVNSPQHSQSRFLIHEIPVNETQVKTSCKHHFYFYF
jgi:hypothetical protein